MLLTYIRYEFYALRVTCGGKTLGDIYILLQIFAEENVADSILSYTYTYKKILIVYFLKRFQ